MKRFTPYVLFVFTLAVLLVSGCSDQQPIVGSQDTSTISAAPAPLFKSSGTQNVPGSYIVVLKQNVSNVPAVANDMARTHGLALGFTYSRALKGFSAVVPSARLNALRSDARVDYIEQDQIATANVIVQGRGNGGKPGGGGVAQVTPWGVTRIGGPGNGVGKTAWIIDTGIDLANADLTVDVTRSANFVVTGKKSPDDGNGHGTHVAGTIAAKNNSIDVVGVAAGATVVAVRVLDNAGSGQYSWVIAGVDYVASAGQAGDVANMSLGGPPSAALDQAILNASANVSFAIAAGNDGAFAGNYSPSRVNGSKIYTIAAIGTDGCLPSWSNWGNPPVDWAAPGVSILSLKKGGGTATMSGTSMATPHVAGLLLLGAIHSDGNACNDHGTATPIAHR